jgi:putative membrane protein
MPTYRHAPLVAATFLACLPAALPAQQPKADIAFTNPGFANPDTPGLLMGQPRADVPNTTDIVFLKQLAMGGRAEVDFGKLAQQRSKHSGVDEFGGHMVKDHSAANDKLAAAAKAAHVELPTTLDPDHQAVRNELTALDGRDFDLRYVGSQIADHQKAVELLIYEIGGGQDAAVRQFAADTLPTVMAHLESAQALHAALIGNPDPRPK